ncbi:MAG TPA: hypothetical protein VJC11_00380, partial [Patescibacteria group bacterium]|nr:hypothetical protein [Patescibacteria group bacterium]
SVTIPGSEIFQKGKTITIEPDTLPTMVRDMYRLLVGVAGIVAVFMMMWAGYWWLFAAGNTARVGQAKEYIEGAMLGLLLSVGSFVFLQFINPDLVNPSKFVITPIPKIGGPVECASDKDLVEISEGEGLSIVATEPKLNKATATALRLAGLKAADEGYILRVTSMYRSSDRQQLVYDCYATKQKTGQCPSSCVGINTNCNLACGGPSKSDICGCPHVAGVAVDVCLRGNGADPTCAQMRKDQNGSNSDQLELQRIMEVFTFKRLCAEWWHFETPALSKTCQAGFFGAGGGSNDVVTDPQ